MIIGGSAGLRMMIALPLSAPPMVSTPVAGGAGELVDVGAGARTGRERRDRGDDLGVRHRARRARPRATIGIVAWPPQVIMLTFGASTCSSRLTGGITAGPTAAGRQVDGADAGLLVARGVLAVHVGAGRLEDQVGQLVLLQQPVDALVAGLQTQLARPAPSPSLSGSTPIIQRGSTTSERSSLYIRSVPMLPGPDDRDARLRRS